MCPLLLILQASICMGMEQASALIPGNFSLSYVKCELIEHDSLSLVSANLLEMHVIRDLLHSF